MAKNNNDLLLLAAGAGVLYWLSKRKSSGTTSTASGGSSSSLLTSFMPGASTAQKRQAIHKYTADKRGYSPDDALAINLMSAQEIDIVYNYLFNYYIPGRPAPKWLEDQANAIGIKYNLYQ